MRNTKKKPRGKKIEAGVVVRIIKIDDDADAPGPSNIAPGPPTVESSSDDGDSSEDEDNIDPCNYCFQEDPPRALLKKQKEVLWTDCDKCERCFHDYCIGRMHDVSWKHGDNYVCCRCR